MQRQMVEITIEKDGSYSFQAKEGFTGVSCREQTKTLEMAIGGDISGSENTKDYYDNGGMNIDINLKL